MTEYVYTTVPGKIRQLLEKIRGVGIPQRITSTWLKTIGFTSSNDVTLLGVLKFVGFADQSGIPTTTWSSFRGAKHKGILAASIRAGYADLYAVYPDAHRQSTANLTDVFSMSSSGGQQVINKTVATFKALVESADFSSAPLANEGVVQIESPDLPPAVAPHKAPDKASAIQQAQPGPALHIDIQIHISAESTTEQIEKIFQSMAKHLYARKEG